MSDRGRLLGVGALLSTGIALAIAVAVRRVETPLRSSLAPAFQLLGTPVKAVDHLVTRVVLVNDLDEREFGEVLRAHYEARADSADQTYRYVNDVMTHLSGFAEKPFQYRAYLLDYDMPNAMALPGGVVLVTQGLMRTLDSEAELAGVLAHELGHIEHGHCIDAVKFQLLAKKTGAAPFGEIVDFAVGVLVSHSFSKTQEDEADEYAYAALLKSRYDPRGVGWAFSSLLAYDDSPGSRPGLRQDLGVAGIEIDRAEFVVSTEGPDGQRTTRQTNRVPLQPGACYEWRLHFSRNLLGELKWRERFELPVKPMWPRPDSSEPRRDRTILVTEKRETPVDGWISHQWCVIAEDPPGKHVITVYVQDSLARAFEFLVGTLPQDPSRADPIRDYFRSHPPLALREAKFRTRAEAWWQGHRAERRLVGQQNLRDRVSALRGPVE